MSRCHNFKHVTFLTFSVPFSSCIKPLTSDAWDMKYSRKSISRSQSYRMCHVAWQKSTNVSHESADFFISTGESPLTGGKSSSEELISTKLHGITSQETVTFGRFLCERIQHYKAVTFFYTTMEHYDLTWGADERWLGDLYWEAFWIYKNWFHKNVSGTELGMSHLH